MLNTEMVKINDIMNDIIIMAIIITILECTVVLKLLNTLTCKYYYHYGCAIKSLNTQLK